MLHKMSEIRSWHHDEMMKMSKPIFFRYYGYWYQDQLREQDYHEKQEAEAKARDNAERNKNWKPL